MTERQARFAMSRLEALGIWKIEPEGKRFTRITVLSNVQEKVQENVQENIAKNQHESVKRVQEKVQEKVHRVLDVVPAVSHDSDVDVSPALRQKGQLPRATPLVNNSRATATAQYETAISKAPDLPDVTLYIDRLYAELSGGHKYPWRGNPKAASILADLIVSHGTPLVMAAAEKFFRTGDPWTQERAWAIDEFAKQFAKLILDGANKRAAKIALEMKDQPRPTTPRELQTQLAAMRRRVIEPIQDYEPAEVKFAEDLRRRLQQKEKIPVGS